LRPVRRVAELGSLGRSFMRYLILISLLLAAPALADIARPTWFWTIYAGDCGDYGVVELEHVSLSGQHTRWETQISCRPFRLSLPFSAPVTVILLLIASAVAGWFAVAIFYRVRDARRQRQAA